jgi:hypothetical protein
VNPSCGHRWWSTSVSGVTRCGACRTRVYVPVDQRPRRYVEEQRARRRNYGKPNETRVRRRDPDEYDADDLAEPPDNPDWRAKACELGLRPRPGARPGRHR